MWLERSVILVRPPLYSQRQIIENFRQGTHSPIDKSLQG